MKMMKKKIIMMMVKVRQIKVQKQMKVIKVIIQDLKKDKVKQELILKKMMIGMIFLKVI